MPNAEALAHIGRLIDGSLDANSVSGTDRAFALLEELQARTLPPVDATIFHYFHANAWANRYHHLLDKDIWSWEQPELEAQILELRRAVRHDGFKDLPAGRQCQILTNLANQLNTVGRFVEAIEYWDRALLVRPQFAMSLGNRGIGLSYYGKSLYDPGQRRAMHVFAYDALVKATSKGAEYDASSQAVARRAFALERAGIARAIDIEAVRQTIDWQGHSLGKSASERRYRGWCLEQRLFLNPLNDLGQLPIAAHDVLTLPSLTVIKSSAEVPEVVGFFNQMKQEFVSARYLFYEGNTANSIHFSDRGVLLYNTLDYPEYSLAVEKIRASFRIAYSIFDKTSFLLNHYFDVGRPLNDVNFRNVWYEPKGSRRNLLLPRFAANQNWPLRGLFWLSKDLFEEEFRKVTEPDAQALNALRNHLEHKYLQIHQGLGKPMFAGRDSNDRIGHSLSRDEFVAKTLRLLKLVRGALIYLSLAVSREESLRARVRENGLIMPIPLDPWQDDWKR